MTYKSILTAVLFSTAFNLLKAQSPVSYVNPFIGATTSSDITGNGLGKTFPGATTPYGLVQVSPNTITGGDNGSGYSYEHTSIEGFAFTQMSGVGWYGDLGNFLVMPATGKLNTSAGKISAPNEGYRSLFSKKTESAKAGYYAVTLDKYNIRAEMTAAPHSGILRFIFPGHSDSRIQIDLARRVGGTSTLQQVKVVDDHTIEGWMKCTPDGGGWGNGDGKADYTIYFYAQFSKPLKNYGVWSADIPEGWTRKLEDVTSEKYQQVIANARILPGVSEKQGKHLGFYTSFATKPNEQVLLKAGISLVSVEGARLNLETEIPGWDFDNVHLAAKRLWNDALSKITVQGGSKTQKTIFYTALYHTMIDPRIVSDVDGKYSGGDGKSHLQAHFQKRSIFSGWDVFRSQMPLQTIINPALVNDMINSLVNLAVEKKAGYLERWEFLNAYSGCMLGNPAVSMIADAYAKKIRNFDIPKAYQLCISTAKEFDNGKEGYTYSDNGIAKTLEYAYADWCIAQLANGLHHHADYLKYKEKSANYRNTFDPEKKWFRPRLKDGTWETWPVEGRLTQSYGCMESNPYQQGWFVPHDVDGMAELMGGKEKAVADLDSMFIKTPESMIWNNYYNHANEPVHHVPFLFNRLGAPWLTQKWTREIIDHAYANSVEGLVGNEDVGQMSAWYVLAASGIHPVCPGDTRQELTSPIFDKVSFKLDRRYARGKTFSITAMHNSAKNKYIQSARLNGKSLNKCYIDFEDIAAGGRLELVMGPVPSKKWGIRN
ncbi:GH92 family glycosyl hydrolase [Mucilaginibacter ginsenosidivorax]|uniref:Glycoside hydrolase family 92 protein n=1 Tax=Mucilaginibacter ginsenosidivorax TaxID=862126 RepID=A0A5B8W7K8_9SPHI|nr:GH92 family glycosyl hydrolase [Mucilaginibacter ginsenosidivorax]QEC78892.1 glycoside hydrolase family 92 protein [Mucilaginibacter ginsenosidivorax]